MVTNQIDNAGKRWWQGVSGVSPSKSVETRTRMNSERLALSSSKLLLAFVDYKVEKSVVNVRRVGQQRRTRRMRTWQLESAAVLNFVAKARCGPFLSHIPILRVLPVSLLSE